MSSACTTVDWPSFASSDSELDVICKLSRFYGADPSIVLAGGGNTSCKCGERLFVKASGTSLATMTPDGFLEMDRQRLERLVQTELDSEPEAREAQYKEAILAARCQPEKGQRPSVEVLLHHIVPSRFVVHSHPTIVNALTCCQHGRQLAQEMFGSDVVWLPYVDPGYTLARTLQQTLTAHQTHSNATPVRVILMENHGLIVAGNHPEEIRTTTEELLATIAARLGEHWELGAFGDPSSVDDAYRHVRQLGPALRGLLADGADRLKLVTFDDSEIVQGIVGTEAGRRAACSGSMTPDHIVYCDSFPLWFEPRPGEHDERLVERLRAQILKHTELTRFPPRIILVAGVGMFAAGDDYAQANTARLLYLDAMKVMAGATRLGGIYYLAERDRRFIEDWEVEAYRKKVAAASGQAHGRLSGKVAVVTGAAQGFGLEIARGIAAEGAHVVLTDVNEEGARQGADQLCEQYGHGRSLGLSIDVTQSGAIRQCLDQVVRTYGGLDVFISNAGVLKAESVKTQPEHDFDFVTNVNYKGYYLCVQQTAPILATQHRANKQATSDIIQINSKSGLVGSKKNFAYAGSKFGGIGLTQSFALELIEDGVKVNSICPGNFFDGPLWSDPENGLFIQYLRAGKVPGATTIDDVRHFYEAKVPMGRGCRAEDVARALLYVIEQTYETGQAIPVTGGQHMLR